MEFIPIKPWFKPGLLLFLRATNERVDNWETSMQACPKSPHKGKEMGLVGFAHDFFLCCFLGTLEFTS